MLVSSVLLVGALVAIDGAWELSGVGDQPNFVAPTRMTLVFDSAGELRISVSESSDVAPFAATGRYTMSGDLLEVAFPGSGPPEKFRIDLSRSFLVLHPVDDSTRRPALSLTFERRPE